MLVTRKPAHSSFEIVAPNGTVFSGWSLLERRLNVLVHVKEVFRIPLVFDFYETFPYCWLVGGLDSVGLLRRHEVHVDPTCGIRCGRFEECPSRAYLSSCQY